MDGSLETSATTGGGWDQFAENERLFGLKTDYDENIYTTAINKTHPQYRERMAAAEKKAREIERSAPVTAHVAEERVMDYVGGQGVGDENEEDKYSGVRRQQDFPPLSGVKENRYTPPAKRAPVPQSNVKGAPIDPAIISSQLKAPPTKQPASNEQTRAHISESPRNGVSPKPETPKATTSKAVDDIQPDAHKLAANTPSEAKTPEAKGTDKISAPAGSTSATSSRTNSAQPKDTTPSATATVERDVLKDFKSFASQQRMNAEKARSNKARADKEVKLHELKKFANSFKLSTPVPSDLVSIIAKDPSKQKEIQAKAIQNAEDMAKTKVEVSATDKVQAGKDTSGSKGPEPAASAGGTDRTSRAPAAPQAAGLAGNGGRHSAGRQQFAQQPYHGGTYRNSRAGGQHAPPPQQAGNLAQRIRQQEQMRLSQPPSSYAPGQDMRPPPTGPSSSGDTAFNRRLSGAPSGIKLNPNSNEFRPSPFAASFNPSNQASAGSSPQISAPNVADSPAPASQTGSVIRRKTKAVDVNKCLILSHIKTLTPPPGRNWDDNGGLRPSYDTLPTWRQLQDDEKPESNMHLTYKELFERQPYTGPSITTPTQPHAAPQLAHQHQLPFHLQHGAHGMAQRQSPHMPHMQMHPSQHGPPHQSYGQDDHRMMHSGSAQSFASPRLQMAYPGQMPYSQPVFMGPNSPQVGPYRGYGAGPHYMAPQQGQMGGPIMMQPQFMPPQGMVAPQMMYHGGQPQFIPPSGPPQQGPGANGYPSPGRPTAPVMVHQGSQQGQSMYGMSPNVQYNQPVYGQGHPGGPSQ